MTTYEKIERAAGLLKEDDLRALLEKSSNPQDVIAWKAKQELDRRNATANQTINGEKVNYSE